MSKLKLEVWKSNMNQQERHFFIEGEGEGYQNDKYVFGYNPSVVSPAVAKKILAFIIKHMKA